MSAIYKSMETVVYDNVETKSLNYKEIIITKMLFCISCMLDMVDSVLCVRINESSSIPVRLSLSSNCCHVLKLIIATAFF